MKRARTMMLTAAALMMLSGRARAQADERGFSVQSFQPAPGEDSYLTVEGAFVDKHLGFSVGGLFDYQYQPLLIRTCETIEGERCSKWAGTRGAVVEHHLMLDLTGSLSVFKLFEIGLALPFVIHQEGGGVEDASGAALVKGVEAGAGLEDIRLHLKLDLLRLFRAAGGPAGLALVYVLTFPVGQAVAEGSFMGDSSLTVHPKIAFEIKYERIRFGMNAGYMWRKPKDFTMVEMGHRITYAGAFEIEFIESISAILEISGQNGFTRDVSASPLEMDGAIRCRFPCGLVLTAGIGGGVMAAVGTPAVRAFAGLSWSPVVAGP
jgi:hypothetical protein